jgi:lipid II:glycine glycyltransferase (peptidoglycan interpeptide bridge formation enzyme)
LLAEAPFEVAHDGVTLTAERLALQHADGAADADWDTFLARAPGGDVNQTSAWARLKMGAGFEVVRLVARDASGTTVGGAQIYSRRMGRLGAVSYVPYGPVIVPNAPMAAIDAIVARMCGVIRTRHLRAVFVQPPHGGDRIAAALRDACFTSSDANVAPSASLRIDVQRDDESLLHEMTRHARADMRRSRRQPLNVRSATRADLRSFAELHAISAARQGFTPTPLHYLESMWDELEPQRQIGVFLVDTDGLDLAGVLVTRFGSVVTERLLGFAPDRLPARLRATEAARWAAITWTRACEARWFDLGGIGRDVSVALSSGADPAAPALRHGRWGHKLALGGTPVLYPEPVELVVNPVLRAGYRAVRANAHAARLSTALQSRLRATSHRTRRVRVRHGWLSSATS